MATKSSGPEVAGKVDEESGTVSVGVVHKGQFLPVATKSLDYAKALAAGASEAPEASDDSGSEG